MMPNKKEKIRFGMSINSRGMTLTVRGKDEHYQIVFNEKEAFRVLSQEHGVVGTKEWFNKQGQQ